MRNGDPFLFWLVQNPCSQLAPSVIGMARLQFHQLEFPTKKNKTGFGPLRHTCACPETPGPRSCSRPHSRAVKGTDRCGKTRHHQPPAVSSSSAPSSPLRCWSMRLRRGETRIGIHNDSSMEPAVGISLPGGAGVEKEGTASLTKDLDHRPGDFHTRFPMNYTIRYGGYQD